ncbi:MAG: IS30 family transposase, partial [Pseudonocardiaceae bacterium]
GIYTLPRGELACEGILLRSGRTQRRPRGRTRSPGARIVGMSSIDARPAEVTDRAVPGHGEGDLVIGTAGKTARATLIERISRSTVPVALPAGRRDATTTCDALITTVSGMPTALVTTLTWDHGTEMATHPAFSLATEVAVYSAHPHAPWESGTNGLLREYFPTGTEITDDPTYLDRVAAELNNRHAVSSATEPQQKPSPTSSQDQLLPPADTKPERKPDADHPKQHRHPEGPRRPGMLAPCELQHYVTTSPGPARTVYETRASLRSSSRILVSRADQLAGPTASTGPVGSLESRTPTRVLVNASSTQSPLPWLWELVRHPVNATSTQSPLPPLWELVRHTAWRNSERDTVRLLAGQAG